MKKIVTPTILILLLASIVCIFIAKEYNDKKRANNPVVSKLERVKAGMSGTVEEDQPEENGNTERLTASDTCLIMAINMSDKSLTFRNVLGGEDKSLVYDGKTSFLSKYDGPMTADELHIGDIVDIEFTTYDSRLSTVKQSEKAWENKNVNRFEIDERGKTITVADELYKLADNVVIASGDSIGKILDVTGQDTITVKGIDKDVYSIQIEKGHGYIRVTNDSYFVGGWIEIGQDIITVMTEGMLIPVPEGTYDIKVTNKGYVGRETLEVTRDSETRLDLSKVEIEEAAIGHVNFEISPDYAQLYVDGLMTDFEDRIPLEYGIHSVRVECAGYETVRANIRVGSEYATISIELDEDLESDDKDKSSGSTSEKPPVLPAETMPATSADSQPGENASSDSTITSTDPVISDNRKIYVEGPTGAEVYFDGSYIGIAPCDTNKVPGNHTITLSKNGYETKSYTISVGNDGKDLTMSFSELSPVQ